MRMIRYLIFLLFNLAYKDGNFKEGDMPYFQTAGNLMVYQIFLGITVEHFLSRYTGFVILGADILKPLGNVVYGWGMFLCALNYPINHYFFIKKGWFDRIYNEFNNSEINTKKNKVIGYVCLIIYIPIMCVIVGHLKYWFP